MATDPTEEPLHESDGYWDKIFQEAVEKKFGQGVQILSDPKEIRENLKKFVSELVFKIDGAGPLETHCCVFDITCKEFCNQERKNILKSTIRGRKYAARSTAGTKYSFQINEGISFDHDEDICGQIVSITMTGGEMRVGENTTEIDKAFKRDSNAQYVHKEKLIIPPQKKATATMTASTKTFYQDYTLKFKMLKSEGIPVTYLTKRQQRCKKFLSKCCCCFSCCFCCCFNCTKPSEGKISADEILKTLSNFDTDDDYCYFTVKGTLTWSSEVYSVKVTETPIY